MIDKYTSGKVHLFFLLCPFTITNRYVCSGNGNSRVLMSCELRKKTKTKYASTESVHILILKLGSYFRYLFAAELNMLFIVCYLLAHLTWFSSAVFCSLAYCLCLLQPPCTKPAADHLYKRITLQNTRFYNPKALVSVIFPDEGGDFGS